MQAHTHIKPVIAIALALCAFNAESKDAHAQPVKPAATQANSTVSSPQATPTGSQQGDYTLAAGDAIRILVFQNPDLTLDTRVSESGTVTYPLIGSIKIGGKPIAEAERAIAASLKSGGFVQQPQVNIVLLQVRGNQVSVIGAVNRPGRYPLETFNTHLSEMLANAGGIIDINSAAGGGDDTVILVGQRNGQAYRKEINVPNMFLNNKPDDDVIVQAGDVIYVPDAPQYYIYGEAQRPGSFRIKRGMSIRQAVAEAGGPTLRGTERGMKLYRRNANGELETIKTSPTDLVQPNDVIFVKESLF